MTINTISKDWVGVVANRNDVAYRDLWVTTVYRKSDNAALPDARFALVMTGREMEDGYGQRQLDELKDAGFKVLGGTE